MRPKKIRMVSESPVNQMFGPHGREPNGEVSISVEEFEAIRLSDYQQLNQEEAAAEVGVSRHTFGRILGSARRAVAEALVTGKTLKIEGGHFKVRGRGRRGRGHGQCKGGGGFRRNGHQ